MSSEPKRTRPAQTYSRKHDLHASKYRRVEPADHPVTAPEPSVPVGVPVSSTVPGLEQGSRTSPARDRVNSKHVASPQAQKRKAPTERRRLVQLTLDLGQALRVSCAACGMSYHPSCAADAAMHKRFHARSVGGVDLPSLPSRLVWEDHDAVIGLVDRRSTPAERRKAREVLDVVDTELSAGEIPEAALWDVADRYKVYLYITLDKESNGSRKAVGCLLAERIETAYQVRSGADTDSSSVSLSPEPRKALLGIARVWTCADYRRRGVALRLLDTARKTFVYGMTLGKAQTAFSQPTESGGRLARSWYKELIDGVSEDSATDAPTGWMVYVERG